MKGCDNLVADCLSRDMYPNQNELSADSPETIAVKNDGDLCDRCSTPDSMSALLDINEFTPAPVNNDAENIEAVLIEGNVNDSQVLNDVIRKEQVNVTDVNAVFTDLNRIEYELLARAQTNYYVLNRLRQSGNHSLTLAMTTIPDSDTQICGDLSTVTFSPLVPICFKKQVIDLVHGFSHPGKKATQKLISERFVWPNMKSDIKKFVQTCVSCQKAKIYRRHMAPLQRFSLPDIKFSEIHIDLVGPFCESDGYNHLLSFADTHIMLKPFHYVILLLNAVQMLSFLIGFLILDLQKLLLLIEAPSSLPICG